MIPAWIPDHPAPIKARILAHIPAGIPAPIPARIPVRIPARIPARILARIPVRIPALFSRILANIPTTFGISYPVFKNGDLCYNETFTQYYTRNTHTCMTYMYFTRNDT